MTPLDHALQLFRAGQHAGAEDACRQALVRDPASASAWHLLGVLAHLRGRTAEAVEYLHKAIALHPADGESHYNLGVALQTLGRRDEAAAAYREALRHRPDLGGAHNNLGRLAQDRGRPAEAEAYYRLALAHEPGNAAYHNNLANLLLTQCRPAEAAPLYRETVRLAPADPVPLSNLATALTLLGRPDEAEPCARAALRLRPDYPDALHNLAVTLTAQGRFDEAEGYLDEALRRQPDHAGARNSRALAWLQRGDFVRGWPAYEGRWDLRGVTRPTHAQPPWDGSPLAGRTLLVHAEQALGDTLQFVRYAAVARQTGGTVILECQPALVRLLTGQPGLDQVVPRGSPLPPADVQAPLLSLPGLLGATLPTVAAQVPYLVADPALVASWRQELAGDASFKVGVAWQGNPNFPGDSLRSMPLRCFAPLAAVPGIRLFGLQKGPGRDQLRPAAHRVPLTDLGDRLDEATGAFMDTAAVLTCLDLVVTSDSALAHLAGALGVPVWVAVPVGADWRWLLDRDDSPWYPTMRLFRQPRLFDWESVFARMAAELRRRLAPTPRTSIAVPAAAGDLLDRLTILDIKARRIGDPAKLAHVRAELTALAEVRDRALEPRPELAALTDELRAVNETLWDVEDEIRRCERAGDFGPRFVELARSVYLTNDRRSLIKRRINDLLGSELVEEKHFTEPAPAASAAPPRRATVCLLTYGDYLTYFRRCLDSVLAHTPLGQVELRLGFNAAPASLAYAREHLPAADGRETVATGPDGVRRLSFTLAGGTPVRFWDSPVNLYKEPMSRLLYHDVPLATEYAIWFDDDSYVEPGWWPALLPLLEQGLDCIGQEWWVDYLPGQAEMIRAQPWYRGVPFEQREGRPGTRFMTGGFMAVRAERLRQVNFPDTAAAWKGDTLKQYGGDTLLGEIARQLGWTRAAHDAHVKVNVDLFGRHPAPRRGGTGRQFGSDLDIAVR